MTNFGTLEFVLDRYAKCWCWKISGTRAVNMVSKLIPRGWYGDKPDEVIAVSYTHLTLPTSDLV